MPRTATRGLEYTFLDKNFFTDRKVKRLRRKCGDDAPYVFLALLCLIAPEGYYIKYDQDTVYDLADMTGFDEKRIEDILETCGEVGLLDRELMGDEHVLTSHGIQKYYADTCATLKRKARVEEYSLLDEQLDSISSEEKAINSQKKEFLPKDKGFLPQNEEGMQTKGKNRKGKNRKEDYYYSFEEEQEEILSFCFFRNWAAPSEEYQKIVAYNNTGGRSWDKMTRIEKESALSLWKQQPEQRPRLDAEFLSFWQNIYTQLRSLDAPYEVRMDALADSIGWDLYKGELRLHCSDRLRLFIERNLDVFKPIIRDFQNRRRLGSNMSYIITTENRQYE